MPCNASMIAVLATIIGGAVVAPAARGLETLPTPRNHVEDRANLLDAAAERQIDGYLTELEQKTGAQIILLTIDTTAGEDLHEYALRQAEAWKLGQRGKDNGAIILVAVKDRNSWIETGYGLEGVLPDSWVGAMQRQYFVPHFKKGDYATGLRLGTLAVVTRVAEEAGVTITDMTKYPVARTQSRSRGRGSGIGRNIWCVIVAIILLSSMGGGGGYYRRRRSWGSWIGPWMIFSALSGGSRGSWGSGFGGGGFGGGGFGGGSFGGGGGGSFGGGGAGASW